MDKNRIKKDFENQGYPTHFLRRITFLEAVA